MKKTKNIQGRLKATCLQITIILLLNFQFTFAQNNGIDFNPRYVAGTNISITGNTISASGGGGSGWLLNGNTNGILKSLGTIDNFNLPVIVSNSNIATFGTDGTTTFNSFGTNKFQILMNGISDDYSNFYRPNNTGGLEFYGGNFYNDGGALWLNGNNFSSQDVGSVQVGLGLFGSSFQVYDRNSQLIFNVSATSQLKMINPSTGIAKFAINGSYGQIQNNDGAVTSPAYSFLSDTTSGVYRNGTNHSINVSVDGTDQVMISASSATLESGYSLKSIGANPSIGNATLVGGHIVVSTTKVLTGSYIFLSRKTTSGIPGTLTYSIINGTSFTIQSTGVGDNGIISWMIVNP